MKKKALLVISYGTSYNETRKKTIEACENKLKEEFQDFDFYRAWTSRFIVKKLKERDNEVIFNPKEALEELYNNGYEEVYVQSLHLSMGEEYNRMISAINEYKEKFQSIVIGRPLLKTLEDYDFMADFMEEITLEDVKEQENTAVVWMGHGTFNELHGTYAALDYRMRRMNIPAYIGTVEGYPEKEDVIYFLKKNNVKKVHLRPLLLVAGDHVNNDMVEDEDSWFNTLKNNGFEVIPHIIGLGEYKKIQEKFSNNLKEEIVDYSKKYKPKKKINNNSKFYGIGVGPGSSDLLTIKAVNTIKNMDIIYVPQPKKGTESLAQKIVNKYIEEKTIIKERHFPMNFNNLEKEDAWDNISKEIIEDVKRGNNVAFLTLGDSMIYSTYVYILRRVEKEIEVETIPGISSFSNIAASNNFPLTMDKESLAVISCTGDMEYISKTIDEFQSIVLMKVYKNFKDIVKLIIDKGLESKSILVSNSSMESELKVGSLCEILEQESIPYFSTILINKKI